MAESAQQRLLCPVHGHVCTWCGEQCAEFARIRSNLYEAWELFWPIDVTYGELRAAANDPPPLEGASSAP